MLLSRVGTAAGLAARRASTRHASYLVLKDYLTHTRSPHARASTTQRQPVVLLHVDLSKVIRIRIRIPKRDRSPGGKGGGGFCPFVVRLPLPSCIQYTRTRTSDRLRCCSRRSLPSPTRRRRHRGLLPRRTRAHHHPVVAPRESPPSLPARHCLSSSSRCTRMVVSRSSRFPITAERRG